jgi:hypothetical protein
MSEGGIALVSLLSLVPYWALGRALFNNPLTDWLSMVLAWVVTPALLAGAVA